MDKYSKINIRETQQTKKVKITSDSKPVIKASLVHEWQLMLDSIANVIGVPSALIMR